MAKPNAKDKTEDSSMVEAIAKLNIVIERMYQNGIKEFKKSVKLRIAYAFFLLEHNKTNKTNQTRSLEELEIAKKLNPQFDEEFLIYRYSRMITEENTNQKGEEKEEYDVVGMIAFTNSRKLVVEYIVSASQLHKDFWFELLEDMPSRLNFLLLDMDKLSNIGSKINNAVKQTREYWRQLIKINGNVPSILMLYGKFLVYVLNEKGSDLIKKSKKIAFQNFEENHKLNKDIDSAPDQQATINVGYNKGEPGFMKKVSKNMMRLFGYQKEELLEKKINMLMPSVYSDVHDKYLTHFLECRFEI